MVETYVIHFCQFLINTSFCVLRWILSITKILYTVSIHSPTLGVTLFSHFFVTNFLQATSNILSKYLSLFLHSSSSRSTKYNKLKQKVILVAINSIIVVQCFLIPPLNSSDCKWIKKKVINSQHNSPFLCPPVECNNLIQDVVVDTGLCGNTKVHDIMLFNRPEPCLSFCFMDY